MARQPKKTGIKQRLNRRVKVLKPVEAPLVSKAKSDDSNSKKADPGTEASQTAKSEAAGASESATEEARPAEAAEAKSAQAAEASPIEAAEAKPAGEPAPEPEAAPQEKEPLYAELIPARGLPDHKPDVSAPPPGLAPPGDSRSFRRRDGETDEFCLLYRWHREVIVRRGPVGKWGTVTVTLYPSDRSAATAYAHACSGFTGEGFYDLRE